LSVIIVSLSQLTQSPSNSSSVYGAILIGNYVLESAHGGR